MFLFTSTFYFKVKYMLVSKQTKVFSSYPLLQMLILYFPPFDTPALGVQCPRFTSSFSCFSPLPFLHYSSTKYCFGSLTMYSVCMYFPFTGMFIHYINM